MYAAAGTACMVDQSADPSEDGRTRERTDDRPAGMVDWLTASILRLMLAVVGVVLVLFALGQAVGINLLDMAADVLASSVGRWLLIALFGLVLVVVALRGFGTTTS